MKEADRWSILCSHEVILLSIWCMLQTRNLVLSVPLLPVSIAMTILLLADTIMIGKKVLLPVFAVFNAITAAGATFLIQRSLVLSGRSVVTHIIFSAMLLVLFVDTAITSNRSPKRSEVLFMFDLSIILEGTLMALSGTDMFKNPAQFIIWGFVSSLSLLVALTLQRLRPQKDSQGKSIAGITVLGAIIAVLGLLAFLSLRDMEAVSSSLVTFLSGLFGKITSFLGRIAEAFFRWLSSLFGVSYVYDFDASVYSQRVGSEIYREYKDVSWLIPVVIAILVVVGISILIRYRKRRMGKAKAAENGETRTRIRTGRLSGFRRKLFGPLLFYFRYLRNRNSAAGRFIRFERRMRRIGIRRPAYETPHAFLRRLSPSHPKENLPSLADELERQFYSGTK